MSLINLVTGCASSHMAHKVQDWQVLETALQEAEVAGVAAELLECLSSPQLVLGVGRGKTNNECCLVSLH